MMKKRKPGRPKTTPTQTKNKGGRPRGTIQKSNMVDTQFVSVESMVAQLSLQHAAIMARISGLENTLMQVTQSLNTCQKTIIDMQRERARERSTHMQVVSPRVSMPAPTPPIREMFDGGAENDLLDSTQ